MKTLLLIDAHAMIHRAFHALPIELSSKSGVPTNAIYGFFMMLQKVLSEFRPTHVAVCFDTPVPTFRKKLFKGYQSKRPPMDDTLAPQIPQIEDLLVTGGLTVLKKEGFEADDVIGTLAEKNKKNFDRVLILTGDRDLLQLVDEKVFVIAPVSGISNFNLYSPKNVSQKFGVPPELIPDYKALAGDASDNYKTAPGIGPKTALKLLQEYQNVEKLLKQVETIKNEKWKTIIRDHKDNILLFKKIATVVCDVKVNAPEAKMIFAGFAEDLRQKLQKLDLYTLITKLYPKVKSDNQDKKLKQEVKEKPTDQMDLFTS